MKWRILAPNNVTTESNWRKIAVTLIDRSKRVIACYRQSRSFCKQPALRLEYMSDPNNPWQEYRKRRNVALFALLGYMPIVSVIAVVTTRLFHTTIPFYVAAVSLMIFYAVASLRCISLWCPRCGKRFFPKWGDHGGLSRPCVHCCLREDPPLTSQHTD